jgi:hypothetical protein
VIRVEAGEAVVTVMCETSVLVVLGTKMQALAEANKEEVCEGIRRDLRPLASEQGNPINRLAAMRCSENNRQEKRDATVEEQILSEACDKMEMVGG